MADVMGAFQEGRYFAQQEQLHKQAMEENKLRTMVLKHHIDGMKIEDKLRQRAIEAQNLQLMEGQPEASMPTQPAVQPNLPSTSHAGGMTGLPGVVSSLIEARNGGAAGPSTLPAPAAQDTHTGSHMTTVRKPMKISGVPEWGIGDTNITPRSAEDIVRASIYQKMMEPRVIPRGGTLTMGDQVVAHGAPAAKSRLELGAEVAAGGPEAARAKATLDAAFPARTSAANSLTPQDVLLDGKPAKLQHDRQGNWFDLDKNPIRNPSTRITRAPNQGSPTAQRNMELSEATAVRDEYKLFATAYRDQHPKVNEAMIAAAAKDGKPTPVNPPAPPSFDKWKVMTDEERQGVLQDPAARITDKEMTTRKAAGAGKKPATGAASETKPAAGQSFSATEVAGFLKAQVPPKGRRQVTLTDGTVWIVYPDGQYEQVIAKK